jgi:tetratricopeptide (TPR) repeat protein
VFLRAFKRYKVLTNYGSRGDDLIEEGWEEKAWHLIYGLRKIGEAIKYLDEILKVDPRNDRVLAIKANALNELANVEKIGNFLHKQLGVLMKLSK